MAHSSSHAITIGLRCHGQETTTLMHIHMDLETKNYPCLGGGVGGLKCVQLPQAMVNKVVFALSVENKFFSWHSSRSNSLLLR